ncbi:DgyrCDS2530 [Dimorphilus gyrociliatus]|uniref:DgyrCDS2530 n=1 Tax=Dimorphilus gyrociliatus TaxID=2664684 RepID=A0A7I8VFQ3_9ANNE|nr:DgyrCDS2530 [Dimorphilus gyrociliatus]
MNFQDVNSSKRKLAHRKPIDNCIKADLKNRIIAARWQLHRKLLDKQKDRVVFDIEKDKRQIVKALKTTLKTSGISSEGLPLRGQSDRSVKNCDYFKSIYTLSEKRLRKWRITERHLQKQLLLKEEENELKSEEEAIGNLKSLLLALGENEEDVEKVLAEKDHQNKAVNRLRRCTSAGVVREKAQPIRRPLSSTAVRNKVYCTGKLTEIDEKVIRTPTSPILSSKNSVKLEESQEKPIKSIQRPLSSVAPSKGNRMVFERTKSIIRPLSSGNVQKSVHFVDDDESEYDNEDSESVTEIEGARIPQWKRDLMAEAPPGVFTQKSSLKVALAISKRQRKRELDKLVDENIKDPKTIIEREKTRRQFSRLGVYMAVTAVREVGQAGKSHKTNFLDNKHVDAAYNYSVKRLL